MEHGKEAPAGRKPELSILNVLFCLLVVLIHVLSHPVSTLDRSSWQFLTVLIPQRLAFAAVSGFFVLSGVKLCLTGDSRFSLSQYYKRRAKTLLLPYLLAMAVYYAYFIWRGYYTFSLGQLCQFWLVGDLSAHFYFVVALIQFVVLVPLWRVFVRKYDAVLALPFALGLSWLCARYLGSFLALLKPGLEFPYSDRVFATYLIYYLAGCYIGRNYQTFLTLLERNKALIRVLFVTLTLADAVFSALLFSGRAAIPFLEEIHIGYQMSAILFCFQLAAQWKDRPLPRPVAELDSVSYLIYLYHCLAITEFNLMADRMGINRVMVRLPLRAMFVYGGTVAGCLLWHRGILLLKAQLKRKEGTPHE
ncbi:MAG: acyltransferase [Oscillospiraceae bacterium]|nr:acyltransferase [Oscillospiraceae bacterium]